ncbi:MAG TPA: GNAT family N-acetyltransferase [candidate division Zixibacteria bacterium]|nr:GNAT family N-acetyltransferase [candidate division Zixibacteria bacterium]
MPDIHVRDFTPGDHEWARTLLADHGGGTHVMARLGELIDPLTLEGLVAEADGRPVGLATVKETPERGLEVLTLHADPQGIGAGTALLETAWHVAAASGHHRLWLVTTNDNLDAIHFYLRRGMRVAAVHENQVTRDRQELKPQIPEFNPDNGLPIRDLIEFELPTAEGTELETQPFPRIEDLDRLPMEAVAHELEPLFEGAPRFLRRLAEARPFETDDGMIAKAFEIARGMPEEEQVELVEAHPRIGAPPASVSEMSYREQGYESEAEDDPDTARAYQELAMLNELYQRRFGFRYVVFVAGRPKTEIVPLLEHALRNDRAAELRRAVDDTIYIAGDRLRTLRGLGMEG